MSRRKMTHLHRTPWWRVYTVHAPNGTFLGRVYPAGVRIPEDWPRVLSVVWVATDENMRLLAHGLPTRERAIEFVTER